MKIDFLYWYVIYWYVIYVKNCLKYPTEMFCYSQTKLIGILLKTEIFYAKFVSLWKDIKHS